MTASLDLPTTSEKAPLVIVPGLGLVPRPVPRWMTDPDAIESIRSGLIELTDDLLGET